MERKPVGDTLQLFDASKIHDASFETGMSLVCSCFECGEESRGRRDEVAFRFEFTRKLADGTVGGGEVVGGEWKKEWRNLSLFRFASLVTVLGAHDPARRQGMYGRSARTVHPRLERCNLDVVFHFRLRGAYRNSGDALGNLANPCGTLDSFQSTGDGFVESFCANTSGVLHVFKIGDRNATGSNRHVRDSSNIRRLFATVYPIRLVSRVATRMRITQSPIRRRNFS
jgi:hypothetical protein